MKSMASKKLVWVEVERAGFLFAYGFCPHTELWNKNVINTYNRLFRLGGKLVKEPHGLIVRVYLCPLCKQ